MAKRRAEPPTGCYYCGRPTRGKRVCASCTDLYGADPFGASAREPVSEGELLGPVKHGHDQHDQWRDA